MTERRVVVTGLGALTPLGLTVPAFWDNLVAGVSGAGPITRFDSTEFRTKFACELKGFDPLAHFDRKEARKMDPFSHYAIVAADEAIADAGLDFAKLDTTRVGVIIGSGIGGLNTFQEEVLNYATTKPVPRFNPFFIPKMLVDIAPGHVSMKYGLRGPNHSCVSACATASNCIIDAFLMIKFGISEVIIAGGAESAVNESGIGGFNAMKALSERNDDPATASRPFDKERDGFVLGEGAGVLVLEDYDHALRRGAKIYAELTGIGMSADAYHVTAPHPEGVGVKLVMENVLKSAGLAPEDVDYINMHGTSTPLGDIAESKAIAQVFGQWANSGLKVSSTKSMTGHLLGAAGGIEAIASILAMVHGVIPPTINHFTDDPDCTLDYTFNQAVRQPVRAAISNTFGFGGHNTSVLFQALPAS
ncbi:MAG: beta-ketoacyl-ACP synthase II [Bacteroidia bacterium]|nr:beta-ketoacyl-ACP synthase II [Bacteroidia bacterium]